MRGSGARRIAFKSFERRDSQLRARAVGGVTDGGGCWRRRAGAEGALQVVQVRNGRGVGDVIVRCLQDADVAAGLQSAEVAQVCAEREDHDV